MKTTSPNNRKFIFFVIALHVVLIGIMIAVSALGEAPIIAAGAETESSVPEPMDSPSQLAVKLLDAYYSTPGAADEWTGERFDIQYIGAGQIMSQGRMTDTLFIVYETSLNWER